MTRMTGSIRIRCPQSQETSESLQQFAVTAEFGKGSHRFLHPSRKVSKDKPSENPARCARGVNSRRFNPGTGVNAR